MSQQLDVKKDIITALIDQLRQYNNSMGTYEKSVMNADFNYAVKLSNGRIEIADELLTDFEADPFNIGKNRLQLAASFFISKTEHQTPVDPEDRELISPASCGKHLRQYIRISAILDWLPGTSKV